MAVTWNPADKSAAITLSNGDLTATMNANGPGAVRATQGKSSGKWYWEITIDSVNTTRVGIGTSAASLAAHVGSDAYGYGYNNPDGYKWHDNSGASYGDTFTSTDIISVALDLDNGKIWFGKNGVWQASGNPATGTNEAFSGLSGTYFPMVSMYQTNRAVTANFGASAFTHSVPSGFTAYEGVPEETVLTDLKTEIKAFEEIISDLLSSIIAGLESLPDLKTEIKAGGISVVDLKSNIAADFLTGFSNLSTEVSAKAQKIVDLLTEVRTRSQILLDLHADIRTRAQIIYDLKSEVRAYTYSFRSLNTSIEALRSKWWLNTEIKAGCAARWNFNTEWNPNRFLCTQIAAKKPYEFSFKTQSAEGYSATEPSVEFKIPGYSFPLRTLFLDYIAVEGINEYSLQLWWARGLVGKGGLKNAKIKAEYINTQYAGGYEVVTCDWVSCKINSGEYKTVNETPLLLGDIPCDAYLDLTLKVECRDCSLTRGLVFFKLNISGDQFESVYGGPIVYRDGKLYHSGLYDDYQSADFVCRLYVV